MADPPRDHINQIIEFFPTFYITFISIIQATALGYLLVAIKDNFLSKWIEGAWDPIFAVLIVTSFLVIVEVWYEYMMASPIFRWIPKINDAIIVFSLGVTQFILIFSIGLGNVGWWNIAMSLVCVTAFFAFHNMYHGAKRLREKNEVVLDALGRYPVINEMWIAGAAIIFFSVGLVSSVSKLNSLFIAIFDLGMLIAFVVRGHFYWMKIVKY
jgi:hypothetical protein